MAASTQASAHTAKPLYPLAASAQAATVLDLGEVPNETVHLAVDEVTNRR